MMMMMMMMVMVKTVIGRIEPSGTGPQWRRK
jgi:hypothetical protein